MFGVVGFLDDYLKVRRKRNLGLTVKQKFAGEVAAALVVGVLLLALNTKKLYDTSMNVPFWKRFKPDPFGACLVDEPVDLSAGVRFLLRIRDSGAGGVLQRGQSDRRAGWTRDRPDGDSLGRDDRSFVSFGQRTEFALLGHFPHARGVELTIFCGAMFGASLGFLWYNAHPAEVFMGDVGALGLGGGLGTVAVLLKQEILLLFIGGVFVIELLSVVLQVASFKTRGKRIFKMAPLHHHFEQLGWEESKVIARFWIAGLVLALFALMPPTSMKLAGAEPVVVGMARSGLAAVELLIEKGARVTAADLNSARSERLDRLGIVVLPQTDAAPSPFLSGQIVLSPACPPTPFEAVVEETARRRGVRDPGDLEQWRLVPPGRNHRHHRLQRQDHHHRADRPHLKIERHRHASRRQRIGTPPGSLVATSQAGQWNVLELSSFQLETIETFSSPYRHRLECDARSSSGPALRMETLRCGESAPFREI